jgi:hypothetical protein
MKHKYKKPAFHKVMGLMFLLLIAKDIRAQEAQQAEIKAYNFFKAPLIEDNSFLIEEAFNQENGVVQFISTCYFAKFNKGDMAYSLTHEIPLKGVKHQISYTLNYFMLPSQLAGLHGLGDLLVNYRYEVAGKDNWALLAPRLSLIVPTGDVSRNLGSGAWGGQLNLPVSKLLSKRLVTHYNAGFTFLHQARHNFPVNDTKLTSIRRNLTYINAGASVIWMPAEKLHLMLEYLSNLNDEFDDSGEVVRAHQMVVNPGLRYAFDVGISQIVPGISLPVAIQEGQGDVGMFFYLSIEPNFNLKSN